MSPPAYLKTQTAPILPVFCSKATYDTRKEARRIYGRMSSKAKANTVLPHGTSKISVYYCPFCQGWHVGHESKRR